MTPEELEHIESVTARAREILGTLSDLADADPYKSGSNVAFTRGIDRNEVLHDQLLRKVIATGVIAMQRQLESELQSLKIGGEVEGGDG